MIQNIPDNIAAMTMAAKAVEIVVLQSGWGIIKGEVVEPPLEVL